MVLRKNLIGQDVPFMGVKEWKHRRPEAILHLLGSHNPLGNFLPFPEKIQFPDFGKESKNRNQAGQLANNLTTA